MENIVSHDDLALYNANADRAVSAPPKTAYNKLLLCPAADSSSSLDS